MQCGNQRRVGGSLRTCLAGASHTSQTQQEGSFRSLVLQVVLLLVRLLQRVQRTVGVAALQKTARLLHERRQRLGMNRFSNTHLRLVLQRRDEEGLIIEETLEELHEETATRRGPFLLLQPMTQLLSHRLQQQLARRNHGGEAREQRVSDRENAREKLRVRLVVLHDLRRCLHELSVREKDHANQVVEQRGELDAIGQNETVVLQRHSKQLRTGDRRERDRLRVLAVGEPVRVLSAETCDEVLKKTPVDGRVGVLRERLGRLLSQRVVDLAGGLFDVVLCEGSHLEVESGDELG